MSVDFKPSQVVLLPVPFVGTFDHFEVEMAATCLVIASARLGDEWKPLSEAEIAGALRDDLDQRCEPLTTLIKAAHFAGAKPPDWQALRERGFAGEDTSDGQLRVFFTPLGFERMRRWARP